MGDPRCPRCNSSETRRVRNYGRPVGNEWQCLDCQRRWDTDESIDWRARALAAEKLAKSRSEENHVVVAMRDKAEARLAAAEKVVEAARKAINVDEGTVEWDAAQEFAVALGAYDETLKR
jgi:transcriptional regulator NrdR family protein